jgi:2-keto-4-pentenoate hydratase/2-oxohepta-3-ene-1,7-dioic acid hydratase in catechol pathway
MKLCRFTLVSDPNTPRSGLIYDGRIYETDGERAIGVHETSVVRLLPPLAAPPSLRFFELGRGESGEPRLTYTYGHSSRLVSAGAEVSGQDLDVSYDLDVRVVGIVQDSGLRVDSSEASSFVLGYSWLVTLVAPSAESGVPLDLGSWFGPAAVTPDELGEHVLPGEPTRFELPMTFRVNGEQVAETVWRPDCSFADLLGVASLTGPVLVGDLLAWPKALGLDLALVAGDRWSVEAPALGTLAGVVA